MLLIAVPVLKPQGQASTGGATGQEFREVGNTVQVDFSDVNQHIIDVSEHFSFEPLHQVCKFLQQNNSLQIAFL